MKESVDINVENMSAPDIDISQLSVSMPREISHKEKLEAIKLSIDSRFANLPKSMISKVAKIRCKGKRPHRYMAGSVKANFTLT